MARGREHLGAVKSATERQGCADRVNWVSFVVARCYRRSCRGRAWNLDPSFGMNALPLSPAGSVGGTIVAADGGGAGPVVYIDRSDVREDRWDELRAGILALLAFVETHQPQMATYGFYLDEHAHQMVVVSVHPDSASLERHIDVGGPEFKKLAPFLALREIEVFGHLSA